MIVKGYGASIELTKDHIIIRRKGLLSFATTGLSGEKSIKLSEITSIQIKMAGLFINGFIHFGYRGGFDKVTGMTDAIRDENSVIFTFGQNKEFKILKESIEKFRATELERERYRPAATLSVADEIEKLASLRDRGVLTEAEFEIRKRKLLEAP